MDRGGRIVVLGGGGPFIVGLVDALATAPDPPPPGEVVLVGRSRDTLDLVAAYGRSVLEPRGWRVSAETETGVALAGATAVVNLIRFGGLEGRGRDERLAADLGVVADETVGPAGLAAAIRIAPGHRALAATLIERCPDAAVLNMANPLGCSTEILRRGGVERAVGLCELPLVTVRQACHVLGVPATQVDWRVAGLNHRSFVYRLELEGRDLLDALPRALGTAAIGGIESDEIASLHAIPMKHHALGHVRAMPGVRGRAAELVAARADILEELRRDPRRSPPSLRRRPQPWFADALVPMLAAIRRSEPRSLVVNVPSTDGVVHEVCAAVSADGVEPAADGAPGPEVARRIEAFVEHERRVLLAALEPGIDTIRAALAADPLIPVLDRTAAERILRDVSVGPAGSTSHHASGIESS